MSMILALASKPPSKPDGFAGAKKRAKADVARLRKVTDGREAKQKRLSDDLKHDLKLTVENLDRIARDEVQELRKAFASTDADDEDFFREIDGVIVFEDDTE